MIIMVIFLWKLNRKIQARYFWNNVLEPRRYTEDEMRKNINLKLIEGPKAFLDNENF